MGKIVDVHAHAILPVWRSAIAAAQHTAPEGAKTAGMRMPDWSPENHIAYMDRNGIAAGVLSWPEGTAFLREKPAAELARAMNEAFAEIIARHPDRFGAFAVLPLDDMDAAQLEMEYALDVLKLDGVASTAQFDGVYLGDKRYDTWFAEMNRRRVTLFVHPGIPKAMNAVYVGPNPSTLEFMFDTTRMVTNLVISGAKSKYSDIKIISTHGGGVIPYLAHRIAISTPFFGTGEGRAPMTQEEVTASLASFYYDITASTSLAQLDGLRRLVPSTRLLSGFDYPMMPEPLTSPQQVGFDLYPEFNEEEKDNIRFRNATALFPSLTARTARVL